MAVPVGFFTDALKKQTFRQRVWQQKYLLSMLEKSKERGDREADQTLALGRKLVAILEEKLPVQREVPSRVLALQDSDDLMKPVEPRLLEMLYGSSEKGAGARYLRERNKKAPEDKYYFRIQTSWDYGWQQKGSLVPARDVNRGRCALLRETFYRRNNAAPDPPHYRQPSGGEVSICSEYSCN